MLPRQLSGRSMRCTLSTCGEISEWDSAVRSVSTAGTYFAWRTYHTRVDGLGSQAGVWYGRRRCTSTAGVR